MLELEVDEEVDIVVLLIATLPVAVHTDRRLVLVDLPSASFED